MSFKRIIPGAVGIMLGIVVVVLLAIPLLFVAGCGEKTDSRVESIIQDMGSEDVTPRSRSEAASALVEIGEPAVEPLIQALNDPNAKDWVRMSMADTLGKIGDPRAVEPLISALGDEAVVRSAATSALGKIGDPRAVEPLISALGDEDEGFRCEAAAALGEIGDPRAVEPLTRALEDESEWVRETAAEALEKIRSK